MQRILFFTTILSSFLSISAFAPRSPIGGVSSSSAVSSSTSAEFRSRASFYLQAAIPTDSLEITTNLSPKQIAKLSTTPCYTQTKTGTWSETISPSQTYTRYIIEGKGSITLTTSNGESCRNRIGAGSLVQLIGGDGDSQLLWDVDDTMLILYSGGGILNEGQQVLFGLLGGLIGVAGLMSLN
ncbi:predicted protein [Thalassiosira pseudonana CCMP1335]|uniref:(S)-ureidoglycine aminohydrolase cupin domain-containing protein n=1 Tax=Thalassiosira pseudonana TaxID=35128 RepID=B8C9Q1_THAPS|nr:predicted protein [Thalassiosira pseudonana CCMP1335]EED90082.1 predicted protein [Thalassiosira pseudonana CCMP1335]